MSLKQKTISVWINFKEQNKLLIWQSR